MGRQEEKIVAGLLLFSVCRLCAMDFSAAIHISMAYKEHLVSPRKALNVLVYVRNMAPVNGGKPHRKKGTILVPRPLIFPSFFLPSFFFVCLFEAH